MAIEFVRATSQRLEHASHADFDLIGPFTINYWLNHNGNEAAQYPMYRYESGVGYIFTVADSLLSFALYVSGVGNVVNIVNKAISANGWHMVTATRTAGDRVDLWIDGVSVGNDATGGGDADPVKVQYIGYLLDGLLVEVAKWDSDLTTRLPALYAGGAIVNRLPLSVDPGNLKYYLEMNQKAHGVAYTGASVLDSNPSGSGHHFTAVNSPTGAAAPISTLGAGPISVLAPAAAPAVGNPWYYYAQQEAVA